MKFVNEKPAIWAVYDGELKIATIFATCRNPHVQLEAVRISNSSLKLLVKGAKMVVTSKQQTEFEVEPDPDFIDQRGNPWLNG